MYHKSVDKHSQEEEQKSKERKVEKKGKTSLSNSVKSQNSFEMKPLEEIIRET